MEELGTLLQQTREQKKISLEQAARETNIAKRYLEALETGGYHIFPGEPYIIGFLRNYAEYLGLNQNECVSLYKQDKIKEESVPPQQLIPQKSFSIPRGVLFTIGGLLFIGLIVFFGNMVFTKMQIRTGDPESEKSIGEQSEQTIEHTQSATYTLTDKLFEKRVFIGDTVIIPVGDKQYQLTVEKTAPEVHIGTPLGIQILALGQSLTLDLNGDVVSDIKLFVSDLDKDDSNKGALIEIVSDTSGKTEQQQIPQQDDIQHTNDQSNAGKYKVLLDAGSAYPVTLNATFRSYCLFRYEQDHTNREERYYQKSEQLTVQANNGIRIWASNGNAVKMQIIAGGKTIDIEVSRPGEVIVKDLKWIKDDETGRYKFVVLNVD